MSGPRTELRDAILTALARLDGVSLSKTWDAPEDITKHPTICVIVTDESGIEPMTLQHADVPLMVVIVGYVRSEEDCRAALDTLIEDVWRIVRTTQAINLLAWKIEVPEISCDDGTRIAKPIAQFVMRWRMHVSRQLTF